MISNKKKILRIDAFLILERQSGSLRTNDVITRFKYTYAMHLAGLESAYVQNEFGSAKTTFFYTGSAK
jgi:hypothetical protein